MIPILQKYSPRTVLIIISENDSAGNTVRAFRSGAFEVIQKPFIMKKIKTVIAAFEQFETRCLKDHYQFHLVELAAVPRWIDRWKKSKNGIGALIFKYKIKKERGRLIVCFPFLFA